VPCDAKRHRSEPVAQHHFVVLCKCPFIPKENVYLLEGLGDAGEVVVVFADLLAGAATFVRMVPKNLEPGADLIIQ
jgi:hypothetical protein